MLKNTMMGDAMLVLLLSMGAVSHLPAADPASSEGKDTPPVAILPPAPDTLRDGVVCLLPERFHRNLDGSFWLLTKLNDETPPEKLDITITFHNGTVSGYAGCNSYVGTFVNPTDSLFGVKDLQTTERKCEEAVCPTFVDGGNWEEKYLTALPKMAKVEKTDSELKLLDAEGKVVMVFKGLK